MVHAGGWLSSLDVCSAVFFLVVMLHVGEAGQTALLQQANSTLPTNCRVAAKGFLGDVGLKQLCDWLRFFWYLLSIVLFCMTAYAAGSAGRNAPVPVFPPGLGVAPQGRAA